VPNPTASRKRFSLAKRSLTITGVGVEKVRDRNVFPGCEDCGGRVLSSRLS
jgi:hypothetical protein